MKNIIDKIKDGEVEFESSSPFLRKQYEKLVEETANFSEMTENHEKRLAELATLLEKNHPVLISETQVPRSQKKSRIREKFEMNKTVEALVKTIIMEDRRPTEAEILQLKQFVGYGGMASLGEDAKGILYEYYTPSEICSKMWELALKYGFKGGEVLEPSAGIGRILEFAPVWMHENFVCYETNPVSAKICEWLYEGCTVINSEFEKRFISANASVKEKVKPEFDLVIGNPPYGPFQSLYAGMGEKRFSHAETYIDYFITRGLDVLKPGGLMVYVIGTEVNSGGIPWLEQQDYSKVKQAIDGKADLIDAYRLPNGLFEETDVLTDIVVFRKK